MLTPIPETDTVNVLLICVVFLLPARVKKVPDCTPKGLPVPTQIVEYMELPSFHFTVPDVSFQALDVKGVEERSIAADAMIAAIDFFIVK